MLKRAAEERYVPPVPLKRRSIEIDASLRAEWRNAEQHQQQQGRATPSAPRHSAAASASVTTTTATVADAFSGLTADDWSCASELNALFSAHAHAFPSIVVRSRTTYTRAETAAVAARVASTATSGAAAAAAAGAAAAGEEKQQQKANQHLALAAHVLSVAFAPFPTAALSLYEIEAPGWLGGWASRWCAAAAAPAPATPRNSPAASSSSSLSSYDSDENNSSNNSSNSAAVIVKLMALHGYAEGQPACGQGAGLGEPQGGCGGGAGGGKPARTVFLPIW